MRKFRIDLQLKKTKTSWRDHIPQTSNQKMKDFYFEHMQDMIKNKINIVNLQNKTVNDEGKENEELTDLKSEKLGINDVNNETDEKDINQNNNKSNTQLTETDKKEDLTIKRNLTKKFDNDK